MPKLKINNIEFYYEIHGKGFPLFLIAGLASDSQSWLPIIHLLSQDFQVIIFDNRGCGRTTPMNTEITISEIADDCKLLADHLNFNRFHVLGHSMGGMIAMDLATRFPSYINKMILVGTATHISYRNKILLNYLADSFEAKMSLRSWFENLFLWLFTDSFLSDRNQVEAAVKFALDYPYPQSPSAFRKQVEAVIDFNCSDRLSSIKTETLIINGCEDKIFSPIFSQNSLQKIQNTHFVEIPNAAHSVFLEQPEKFCSAILNHLLE